MFKILLINVGKFYSAIAMLWEPFQHSLIQEPSSMFIIHSIC